MLRSDVENLNSLIDEVAVHGFAALRTLADYRESPDPAARGAYAEIHKLISDLGTLRMHVEILGRMQTPDPRTADGDHGGEPVRVAVVDAYGIVVAGIAAVLAPHESRVRVIEDDGAGRPQRGSADIVLYDTFGPVRERDLDRDIARLAASGDAKVVVFSWNLHPDRVARALRRGAVGYLAKSLSAEEIVTALERVRAGETVVAPHPAAGAPHDAGWPGRDRGLTHREAQVLTLIARGLDNGEIAARLSLSPGAVRSCIRSTYRKIGISRRAKVIGWAIAQGFLLTDLTDPDRTPDRESAVS